MENHAAWQLEAKAHPFKVDAAPMPTPGPKDVLIRNHAAAINPCDHYVQTLGILYTSYPTVLGEDVAGVVAAVGSDVTRFAAGDRVLACCDELERDFGAFQAYSVAHETLCAGLPANVSFVEGAVLPLGLCTAAQALFNKTNLALPYPAAEPAPVDKVVLVWGGSTSVGSCAIQMIRAAGYRVAATASAHNFEYLKDLGVEAVFDYKSPNVVDEVVAGLKDHEIAGIMAAMFDDDIVKKCADIASKLKGKRHIATVHPSADGIPKDLPEGVVATPCAAPLCGKDEVGVATWGGWLTSALESGQMRCKPDAEVVGQGVDKFQEACDRLRAGVSAKKIVVELP